MNEGIQRCSSAESVWQQIKAKRRTFSYTPVLSRKNLYENKTFVSQTKKSIQSIDSFECIVENRNRSKTDTDSLDVIYRIDEYKKDRLNEKVKEFMTKEIPGRPPSSLRYVKPKPVLVKTALFSRQKTKSPINTNSCPNLHMFADTWSYNYRPGKCRYLRCPPSPILQPHEIFSN